ncbi:MAG TPA: SDR family oxidoreductase [Longimicrobiales bacterium]|nr:SDR family oxidoreductase [Longimicrobiales bacterium]
MLEIDLLGKRALVTGGSRGVGRAVALMLGQAGARVGISYHSRHDEAAAVCAELEQLGVPAWSHPGDLSERREVEQLFRHARDEFGGLDIFVGNAGIWIAEHMPVTLMSDEQWHRTLAVNLNSIFYCTREAARMMAGDGRIVLISSTAGQRGEAGHADYAASKGALISFVKGVAVEMGGQGTTVNCVAPGWIDTDMAELPYAAGGRRRIEAGIPLGRVATPEDVAAPVVFLCSGFARHITGETVNVNGGAVMCG